MKRRVLYTVALSFFAGTSAMEQTLLNQGERLVPQVRANDAEELVKKDDASDIDAQVLNVTNGPKVLDRGSRLTSPLVLVGFSLAAIVAYKIWKSNEQEALMHDHYCAFISAGFIPQEIRGHIIFFSQFLEDRQKASEFEALSKPMRKVRDEEVLNCVEYLLRLRPSAAMHRTLSISGFNRMRKDLKRYQELLEVIVASTGKRQAVVQPAQKVHAEPENRSEVIRQTERPSYADNSEEVEL